MERIKWQVQDEVKGQGHNVLCEVFVTFDLEAKPGQPQWNEHTRLSFLAARVITFSNAVENIPSTPASPIMKHGAQKMFPLLIRQRAAGGGWDRGCNQWWQWRIVRATKAPLCVPVSPFIFCYSHVSVQGGDSFPGAQTTPPLTLKICPFSPQ